MTASAAIMGEASGPGDISAGASSRTGRAQPGDGVDAERRLLRVLIPVNASERSLWAVRYAQRLHREGRLCEVVVLNVGEPVNQWQVMQFRTQQEIGLFQSRKAQSCIDEAIRPLAEENVPCRGVFKQGEVVFSILDTAEELECDEIVLPRPKRRWIGFLGQSVVRGVLDCRRSIPVVLVNAQGEPA